MYTEYDWTTGDTLTAGRMDNLEQQWQEAMQETFGTATGGSVTLDVSQHTCWDITLNGNLTVSLSNVPSGTGRVQQITLRIKGDGTQRTLSFSGITVNWPGAVAPTLTATSNRYDYLTLVLWNGGTTWQGFLSGQNLQ